MIRASNEGDTVRIFEMIQAFGQESVNDYVRFEPASILRTIDIFMRTRSRCLFVAEVKGRLVGLVAGFIYQSVFDNSQYVAKEAIWFVDKAARGTKVGRELLETFEMWAKVNGAHQVVMIHLQNNKPSILEKLYKRMGYVKTEAHFLKEV